MGDIVNLRRVRKDAARRVEDSRAAENRYKHGRSKSDRALEVRRNDKSQADLEAHRIEMGDGR
jgi:hypothetical protein